MRVHKSLSWQIVLLVLCTAGYGATATSLSQYGITWNFSSAVEYGQFVNGDYWVVGPVTVDSVTPAWDGSRHGSMVDTATLASQGYRAGLDLTFNPALRATFPLMLSGVKSLVSTIGLPEINPGGAHEGIDVAAVLTVVAESVPVGTFRPPYVEGAKPFYNTSDIDYNSVPLLDLPPGAVMPNLDGVMTRVWLDHTGMRGNAGGSLHPSGNMPPYPRDSSLQMSTVATALLVDSADRNDYIHRMVQLGIDLYHCHLTNGDAWRAYGGFGSGRKWPILFAGIVLGDTNMQNPIATTPACCCLTGTVDKFGEDGHTYYGAPTPEYPGGKPMWGQDCTAGMYEYRIQTGSGDADCRDPNGLEQMDGYRVCCTSHTWVGGALAAHVMNAVTIWDHNAFFDYVDWWVYCETQTSVNTHGNAFIGYMWDAYRGTGDITVNKPRVSPDGGPFIFSVQVTLSTMTKDATIYYTTDGNTPTRSSTQYTGPFTLRRACTVKAFAVRDGLGDSAVTSAAFSLDQTLVVDFNDDGVINFADLKIMVDDWLASDFVSTGLVSSYKFEGDANDNFDGNHGIEVGDPCYAPGMHGAAISLDGVDDYVNCGNDSSFEITGPITLCAWIKGTLGASWTNIIGKGLDWQLSRGIGNEAAFFCMGPGFILGSTNINDNQWHHVVAMYDMTRLYLYVDGEPDASTDASGSLNVSDSNVYIGGSPSASFNGLIDDVCIYDRALSVDEIEILYYGLAIDLVSDSKIDFRDMAILVDNWDWDWVADTVPPTPDPMTWDVVPYATGVSSVSMTATTATDPCGVEYYFAETSGNPGGSDSDWQDSTTYEDTGLDANTTYSYKVKARDKSANYNETDWSDVNSATTGQPVATFLDVQLEADDYYTITAVALDDPNIAFWQLKLDIQSGGIFSFKDLTDAGDGMGDHTDYCDDGAYNRKTTLLRFSGRNGYVLTRYDAFPGLADRLSFTEGPDGSSFTIDYEETISSTAFYHSYYEDGDLTLNAGELLTAITLVIKPPTADGTFWDWTAEYENVCAHDLSAKIWAVDSLGLWLWDDIAKTSGSETSMIDGDWNPSDPESYIYWTIGSNPSMGLTEDRQFIIDRQIGLAGYGYGGSLQTGNWAGFDYIGYVAGYNLSAPEALPPAGIRTDGGQVIIDITAHSP